CMPPRAGKSALASDMFPSWVLGKHPDWPIIASSYAQSLPVGFSRNIRDRIQDPEHRAIFPDLLLRSDAKGVEEWKTTKGGGYTAAGVGTGITGKGFMIGIIDDPIKDQEEADSEVIRNNAWGWYQSTFRTRAAPGAGILVINTRWHWHDVSGRALEQDEELKKAGVPVEERENWEVVSYPAIAEGDEHLMRDGSIELDPLDVSESLRLLRRKGEALHPERYPLPELQKLKNNLSSSIWNALYQQKPTPDEGDFFIKDDMKYRWLDPAYRPLCRIFMTVDYAIGKKQRNDYTVMGVWALDSNDDLYLLEGRRGRWKTQEIVDNVVALVERHKPEVYAGEQGQIHLAVWPLIEQALVQKRLFISVDETLVPIQDKEVRARPLQSRMQRRKLFFSFDDGTKPEFYDLLEREFLQFPNGANDDIVDMSAWGARLAQNIALPTQKAPPRKESWQAKLKAATSSRSSMAA
ncbi:MAG TPA: terminase family protein, partial [Burkholderiaceae bacterium]|nr:terminase family protein [Burkholderiaceae bacterium]